MHVTCNNLFEEVKKKCKENIGLKPQLFTFVCFLAGMNGFIDGIIESNDFCEAEFLTLRYYIYESQNPEEAKKIGKILSKHLCESEPRPRLYRIPKEAKILLKLLSDNYPSTLNLRLVVQILQREFTHVLFKIAAQSARMREFLSQLNFLDNQPEIECKHSSSDSESPDSESEHTSSPSSSLDLSGNYPSKHSSSDTDSESEHTSSPSSSHNPTVLISTPQDMYVFGYSLVHMSVISWNVSFNPLVFSIKDHKQDGEIYGKIKDVKVWTLDWSFKAINSLVPITGITIFQGFYHSSIHVLAQMPPEELSNLKYLNFAMHIMSCIDKRLPQSITTVTDIAYKTSIINYFLCSNECQFNIIDSFYLRIQDCITLSHALRHPDISLLNLKRAKSLHDITASKESGG